METRTISFSKKESQNVKKIIDLQIPIDEKATTNYEADFYGVLPLLNVTKETLIIEGTAPESFFQNIKYEITDEISKDGFLEEQVSDKQENEHYHLQKEVNRPTVHFTPQTGWMNDPNGLVYENGTYHLYFQYNPYDINWNNMCWGHAISTDLIHWQQLETVLYPDEYGTIFSGSGIRNDKKMLGLSEEALIFFYTAAGESFTQRIAYSTDHGKTLTKLPKACLDTVCKENRDPKVFWHEETGAYIMVLWLEEKDFGIFRSANLTEWEQTDRIALKDAWECPDLVKIPCENGNEKWAFFCADGYYFWGDFDGYRFKTDGLQHKLYLNNNLYAAQTYSGVEDRVVFIPWLRLPNNQANYTGAMGIPRCLTAKECDGELTIFQEPVREWNNIIEKTEKNFIEKTAFQFVIQMENSLKNECRFSICGMSFFYNNSEGILTVDGEDYLAIPNIMEITGIVDHDIVELFLGGGRKTAAFQIKQDNLEKENDWAEIKKNQITFYNLKY